MTSEGRKSAGPKCTSLNVFRTRLHSVAAATSADTHALVKECEIQRERTEEVTSHVRKQIAEISETLERAERLAEATMQPPRIWDEASIIVGSEPVVNPTADNRLVWVLEEAANICEMFLQNPPSETQKNPSIASKIDSLLEALGEEER